MLNYKFLLHFRDDIEGFPLDKETFLGRASLVDNCPAAATTNSLLATRLTASTIHNQYGEACRHVGWRLYFRLLALLGTVRDFSGAWVVYCSWHDSVWSKC